MQTHLISSTPGLVLLVIDFVVIGALFLRPIGSRHDDDQGDGRAIVLLPPPNKVSHWRTASFLGVFIIFELLDDGLSGSWSPDTIYAKAVTHVASVAVRAPAEINGYLANFTLGVRFLIAGTILALAFTAKASPVRRLLIAAQAAWYLAVMLCIDSLLIIAEVLLGVPVAPTTNFDQVIALVVGLVALIRALFVSFALPRPTTVPYIADRSRVRGDSATQIVVTLVSFALALCIAIPVAVRTSSGPAPLLAVIMPVLFFAMANALRTVLLNALRWLRAPDPPVADSHVPIEVIIPAFNEEEWIVETLEAIDAAAENYGAPVRVVMTDDGSTDRTNELAKETAANFRFATAEVIDGPHLGKSAALNTALFTCRADIVVRIDADTLVDRWCFYYMARWFQDPEIGQVEAMSIPRRGRSVFRKMRVFENLRRCGFAHRGAQTVDGVDVVPGYFTAFRREPAMRLGGFTRGMNGEDADLTLGFARLGYRTWLDEKVVVYEDVPPTYLGFREQRHRWNRSTFQVFARHSPLHAGVGNPKVWFYLTRQLTIRLTTPFRLVVVLYVFVYLIVEGSYQTKFFLLTGYMVIVLASAAVSLAMSVRFNALDRAGWIILWPFFVLLLYVFGLEALLSLPTRPAHLAPRRAEPVLAPVIH